MVTSPFLVLCLASVIAISVTCENNTTVKKRRGRPKKVTEEKATLATTFTSTVPTVPSPTGTTFDEYETWFDKSGWWHPANKTRTPGTTKKRRTKKTRYPTTTSTEIPKTEDEPGGLERMYYSMKQQYNKPGKRKEADHQVRDIIKKYDQEKGVAEQYTWVSIEEEAEGSMHNSDLKKRLTKFDISDI